MWDLPGPEIELVSAVLQGGFLASGPPGKSRLSALNTPALSPPDNSTRKPCCFHLLEKNNEGHAVPQLARDGITPKAWPHAPSFFWVSAFSLSQFLATWVPTIYQARTWFWGFSSEQNRELSQQGKEQGVFSCRGGPGRGFRRTDRMERSGWVRWSGVGGRGGDPWERQRPRVKIQTLEESCKRRRGQRQAPRDGKALCWRVLLVSFFHLYGTETGPGLTGLGSPGARLSDSSSSDLRASSDFPLRNLLPLTYL